MENLILDIIKRNLPKADYLTGYERYTFEKVLYCRTRKVPHMYTRCDSCGTIHPVYQSCKNRMCPICNGSGTVKWIAQREQEILPCPYFLLTYTIPAELRPLFLANRNICYDLLFKAVSRSLIQGIKQGHRGFHGEGGFFAMLHTWDQRLIYHPHLHVVIPGGCLNEDRTEWISSSTVFLLPVRRLSYLFRDKLFFLLRKEIKKGSLSFPSRIDNPDDFLTKLKAKDWVVNIQAPGKKNRRPEYMIRYLSRYVNKTAISSKRIVAIKHGKVHLAYVDRKRKKGKVEILSEKLFFRRLTFHILPKGFKKMRFYGFMANRYKRSRLQLCRMLMGESVASLEDSAGEKPDIAFLFWKYFKVDITECPDCHRGHVSYFKGG